MPRRKQKTLSSKEQLDALEAHLAGILRPVRPPRDFVRRLRERVHVPTRGEIARRVANWPFWFVIVGGVVSVALLILTFGRAFFHLFGRKNMA